MHSSNRKISIFSKPLKIFYLINFILNFLKINKNGFIIEKYFAKFIFLLIILINFSNILKSNLNFYLYKNDIYIFNYIEKPENINSNNILLIIFAFE